VACFAWAVFRTASAAKAYDRGANAVDVEGLLFLASRRSWPTPAKAGKGEGSALLQGAGQAAADLRGGIRAGSHSARQRPTIGEHGLAHALGGRRSFFVGARRYR